MRIAYLECFAGVSGDMLLGALLDTGVPAEVLQEAVASLNLGASLRVERVDRSGIAATKVHVYEGAQLAEAAGSLRPATPPQREPAIEATAPEITTQAGAPETSTPVEPEPAPEPKKLTKPRPFSPFDHQRQAEPEPISVQPQTQHLHRVADGQVHDHTHDHSYEHPHTHEHEHHGQAHGSENGHGHTHGRSLSEIQHLIEATALHEPVKALALRAFELLGASEAKIHNVPMSEIHFHEVGAVDAIVDIVAVSAGIYYLGVDAWFCSPLNVGGGMVQCAHGQFPVPAPATADLLQGIPTYSAHVEMELVTPTGAALIRALDPTFGRQPAMRTQSIGYGAGTRNPEGFPNVLRLQIGEEVEVPAELITSLPSVALPAGTEEITVLETALDDLSPQLLAHVTERILSEGALDVMLTPVIMKKGRPGTLITVLAKRSDSARFEDLLLRETSTLGVRTRTERRAPLEREHVTVDTPYGPIRVKLGIQNGQPLNAAPEFEDCRAAAAEHDVPVKQVQQAAIAAYHL